MAAPKLVPLDQAKQVIIWDTHNLAYRCYYQRDLMGMTTSEGAPSGHIQGLFIKLQAFLRDQISEGTALVFALDKYPKRKHDLFPGYKKDRDHSKFNPIPDVIKFLSYIPCTHLWAEDEECDDAIASFCYQNLDIPIRVITADKDMWQLLRLPHVTLGEKEMVDNEKLEKDFGLTRETSYKIALYKAIRGDTSDSIPCIPYLFPKVKKAFYACNGTLKDLLAKADEKEQALLQPHVEQIRLMYQLTKLRRDLDVQSHWYSGNQQYLNFFLRRFEALKYIERSANFYR